MYMPRAIGNILLCVGGGSEVGTYGIGLNMGLKVASTTINHRRFHSGWRRLLVPYKWPNTPALYSNLCTHCAWVTVYNCL